MKIHVQSFSNSAVLPYLNDLARLRIKIFREFPYLYDGNFDYEQAYIRTLADAKNGVIVIAFDENKGIGASTGMPLSCETPAVQKPFLENGYDISTIFYFGESVLQKDYRGTGIGVEFFKQREAHARSLNPFEYATFCSVIRPNDHPLRPKDYQPLDDFWKKRGFEPTEMLCYMEWKEVDVAEESAKPLRFWMKRL